MAVRMPAILRRVGVAEEASKSAPSQPTPQGEAPPDEARVSRSTKEVARELRRERARRLALRLSIFVLLPTVLAAIFYGFIATDQFESHSTFTVHAEGRAGENLVGGMASGPGSRDALTVRDYALSRDMLARLDKEHAIIAHYKSPWVDWFSRLRQSASFEDAYEYFGDKISADYDSTSGAVNLRVRAFSAEKAAEFSSAILDYSEEKVNSLTQRERRDVLQYAESEFARAEIRLTKIKMDIVSLRQKRGDLSFDGGLLRAAQDVLKAPAPATKPAKGFDAALVEIEAKKVEKELADKAYASALTALENARADADRKHRYLAVVAGPSKPDVSKYPRRLLGVVNAGVVSFLLMGIATLIVAAVREHARL